MNVAIVVVAYTRADSLRRLLDSLARADYEGCDDVPLLISVDGGGDARVGAIAQGFRWPFGEKEVHLHKANLGLKAHVLGAGDRTCDFDGIIMLEDDLMVSPMFFRYANDALKAYQDKGEVAGISLYSYRCVHELPFLPSVAHGNTFLVRFPSSSGQAWTTDQWQRFRRWLGEDGCHDRGELDSRLPAHVANWPSISSWKKEYARYLVDSGKYIVYPDISLTTNMGDAGYHWQHSTLLHQVPLQVAPAQYRFTNPSRAVSYDQFFELEPRSLGLLGYHGDLPAELEFDLYGRKPPAVLRGKLAISSKRPRLAMRSFGADLLPHELNVVFDVAGRDFYLGEGSEFEHCSQPSRLNLLRHQTAFMGGRVVIELLGRTLLAKAGIDT